MRRPRCSECLVDEPGHASFCSRRAPARQERLAAGQRVGIHVHPTQDQLDAIDRRARDLGLSRGRYLLELAARDAGRNP